MMTSGMQNALFPRSRRLQDLDDSLCSSNDVWRKDKMTADNSLRVANPASSTFRNTGSFLSEF